MVHLRWVLSGIATVGCAGLIAQALIEDPAEQRQGMVLAFAAYLTGLVVVWRALEPVWDELYPGEQARILRLLIERIDVAPDGISVTLHAAGIRSLVVELAGERATEAPMLEAAE